MSMMITGREPRGSVQEVLQHVCMPRLPRARPESAVERLVVVAVVQHLLEQADVSELPTVGCRQWAAGSECRQCEQTVDSRQ
jgi:hypothetical protein